MTTVASLPAQEPPFPAAPFLDKSGKIDPIWQLWLIAVFNSLNGQTAAIVGSAPLNSPQLTGTPEAPTAAPLTNGTQISTTAYADNAVAVETTRAEAEETTLQTAIAAETARAEAAEALLAPKASPTFTGVVNAPVVELTSPTPTGSGSKIGLGNTTGVGNGGNGNVQAPAQGSGGGPATPGTIVDWLEIDKGGSKYWIPLCQ